MTFAAIFPYAIIPHLDAQVLEFPLDDERYRLVLVLPRRRRGLAHLLRALRSVPLRHLCAQLLPTRVHAVIPSFMVDDYVTLTAALQKLGIWDVFDPRRADLGVMTDDRELFVRNIEQSITVVIRNYVEVFDIQSQIFKRKCCFRS
ncbi:Serine protease inhibitor 77Ba [Gryllus bimaculatus]|nr:Serine protease inhibitor 77Ba [Gryllus bimaculatus]